MGQAGGSPRERFEALFEGYHADVAPYVRRRAPAAVVEDVVSDTFLVAWRSLDHLHGDPLPWLYGVARRVLANDVRGERRRAVLAERLARERDREDEGVSVGVSEPLRAALLSLGEREREAVLLIAWEGLTPAQAAGVVGCSGATFRGRLFRARRHTTARPSHQRQIDPPQGAAWRETEHASAARSSPRVCSGAAMRPRLSSSWVLDPQSALSAASAGGVRRRKPSVGLTA